MLRKANVGVNVHYIPIHTQQYYLKFGFQEGDFPVAESFYKSTISIPLFQSMTVKQQGIVVRELKEALL